MHLDDYIQIAGKNLEEAQESLQVYEIEDKTQNDNRMRIDILSGSSGLASRSVLTQ